MTPKTFPSLTSLPLLVLAAGLALVPLAAGAVTADWSLKLKAAGLTEDERDPNAPPGEERSEGYLDVQPQLHTQFSPDFAHFVRVQGFFPSGQVTSNEQDEPVEVENYAALREFFFDIGGITSYPGELLRLGLQRLREPDGLWYDRDIETARWIFDTTLFQFQVGAAKQFQIYRTDDVELPRSQQDRAYGFMGISTQWVPRNFVGARAAYATDQKELPANGEQMEDEGTTFIDPVTGAEMTNWREPEQRRYGWLGVFLDNRFYEWERGPGLAYRVEVMGLRGRREVTTVDPATGQVTGSSEDDVRAVGGDAALRGRFPDPFPLTLGGAYAYGEGGRDDNGIHDFRQTGLQSNRSRFTGTRTILNRFNEALQADLTNLRAVSAFVALPMANWDVSAVAHRFERDDPTRPVYTDGIDLRPDPASTSTDLGTGWDAVVTWHFMGAVTGYSMDDDRRSNIRLRASQFAPGEAYAPDADRQNRVTLEGTLWF